jgi:branched-chain amino acid transport system permease protein
MGVNVQAYKARVFLVSSMYAGLSGVLYALSIGSIAPESFTLVVSIQYLAMIVLGGLGSVGGAALGALFVTALPLLFQQYADVLPLVSAPGQGGISAGFAARFLYGAAIILIVLFEPAGLAGIAQRLTSRFRRGRAPARGGVTTPPPEHPAPHRPPPTDQHKGATPDEKRQGSAHDHRGRRGRRRGDRRLQHQGTGDRRWRRRRRAKAARPARSPPTSASRGRRSPSASSPT